jgi:hypothetical protein
MRGLLRLPHVETRLSICCGVLMVMAVAVLAALYFLAEWVATNEVRAVTGFLPRPASLADILRH